MSVRKEKLDCEYSELKLDPSWETDRGVIENLSKFWLVKVSKLDLVYDDRYEQMTDYFMKSL